MPKDFLGLAPMSVLCQRISSVLNPGVEDLDCPLGGADAAGGVGVWAPGTAEKIRFLFREFVSELLQVRCGMVWYGWYGLVWYGTVYGMVWCMVWCDMVWCGIVAIDSLACLFVVNSNHSGRT